MIIKVANFYQSHLIQNAVVTTSGTYVSIKVRKIENYGRQKRKKKERKTRNIIIIGMKSQQRRDSVCSWCSFSSSSQSSSATTPGTSITRGNWSILSKVLTLTRVILISSRLNHYQFVTWSFFQGPWRFLLSGELSLIYVCRPAASKITDMICSFGDLAKWSIFLV